MCVSVRRGAGLRGCSIPRAGDTRVSSSVATNKWALSPGQPPRVSLLPPAAAAPAPGPGRVSAHCPTWRGMPLGLSPESQPQELAAPAAQSTLPSAQVPATVLSWAHGAAAAVPGDEHIFHLNMRKNFFPLRVTEHWNRLPREVVESPSLEIFQTRLDKVLCSLLWVTLLQQEGWTG